jgi:hypothetical protein
MIDGDTATAAVLDRMSTVIELRGLLSDADLADLITNLPTSGFVLTMHYTTSQFARYKYSFRLSPDAGVTWLTPADPDGPDRWLNDPQPLTNSGGVFTVSRGNPGAPWWNPKHIGGRYEWQAADLTADNLRLRLQIDIGTGAGGAPTSPLYINEVTTTAYAEGGGAAKSGQDPYPLLTITGGGIEADNDANGPPPPASSAGCVFENRVCLNDTTRKGWVWFSGDNMETFPPQYYINIETEDNDEIRCMRSNQDLAVVGLTRHIARLNYLPTEQDLDFSRGRAYTIISDAHGIVGPKAATLVNIPGMPPLIAFIDPFHGLCGTDGHRIHYLTEGLKWKSHVDTSRLRDAVLLNHPARGALVLFTPTSGSTGLSHYMTFFYRPTRRSGRLRVLPGNECPESVAACTRRDLDTGKIDVLLRDLGGNVWMEDTGTQDASKLNARMQFKTREIYPGGIGMEARTERLFIRYHDLAHTSLDVRFHRSIAGEPPPVPSLVAVTGLYERGLTRVKLGAQLSESAQVEIETMPRPSPSANDAHHVGIEYITFFGKSYGPEG